MRTFVKLNPIHRDLMIALTMGFAAAVGIVSAAVIIFG